MTPQQLAKEQKRLRDKIDEIANNHRLGVGDAFPIYDGVFAPAEYLNSKLRVAWVLKEAYDDFDESGDPIGGGWSIGKCLNKSNVWDSRTWRTMAYVMYGFNNGCLRDKMDNEDRREMIKTLKSIAYINLSKMPGRKSSSMSDIQYNYNEYWKELIAEQLQIYAPEVIIFGYTFDVMKEEFPNVKEAKGYAGIKVGVRYWRYFHNGAKQILLDTYHPSSQDNDNIDALIKALRKAFKELKK